MSWIVRDPPSPFADNSSKLNDTPPKPDENTLPPPMTPEADPFPDFLPPTDSLPDPLPDFLPPPDSLPDSLPDFLPLPDSLPDPLPDFLQPPDPLPDFLPPPPLRLDLVEEQWSTNPLRIKSTFSTTGTGIQSVTSPACGMGWTFNLSPDLPAESASRGRMIRRGGRKLPKRDTNAVRILASLRPSPAGFQPGTFSIRASFRRDDCVLAVLDVQPHSVLKGQSTISLGRCDIPLPPTPTPTPLDELFIDVDVTVSLLSGPVEDPQKLSVSMTKAIRASLDGNFPVDVKFMLFSRKSGGTSVCRRRPIYASSSILKGRNSLLDSYMNGSSDPPSPGVHQYPYDEDSDLESDLDEDPPCDVPEMSDITAREDPCSCPLSPVNITDLDTVQSMPPESPSGKISPVPSIFDVASDSSPFSVIPYESSPTRGLGSLPRPGTPDSIRMSDYDKAESPVCDVQADKVESQEKVSASLPRLALINDVAFRTFRALIVYMYTKEVAFIPLKSSGGRSYNVGDACSPKSMYRLAVKASHEGLKKHAFDNLRSQLTPQNIITEIFSKFTADYPEIFEMELTVLLNYFTNPAVRDKWERMIDTVVSGHLPRGADILKKVTRALRT